MKKLFKVLAIVLILVSVLGATTAFAAYEPTTMEITAEQVDLRPPPNYKLWTHSDCAGWAVGLWVRGRALTMRTGSWADLYGPESATAVFRFHGRWYKAKVYKDATCIHCKVTIAYYQARVKPTSDDVPIGYISLPFGYHFCPVITPKGTVPAEHRITSVCSLCPEDYPGGYVFEGSAEPEDVAPVYKVECYGKKVQYVWFGADWTKWGLIYDPMYTVDGRLDEYPRCDGCIDWIKDNASAGIY